MPLYRESKTVAGTNVHSFFVAGDPRPQGSKRLVRLRNGRTAMIDASKGLKPWRIEIARQAQRHSQRLSDDVRVDMLFVFARPKSHFNSRGELRPNAPRRPRKLDLDKLARAVCDALTGVAYDDDRQVAILVAERRYTDSEEHQQGVRISVCNI